MDCEAQVIWVAVCGCPLLMCAAVCGCVLLCSMAVVCWLCAVVC
jgi:hypothetical protein